MARDASSAGDRVASENYLQHAEHYYRILAVQREEAEARNASNPQNQRNGNRRNGRGDESRNEEGRGEEAAETTGYGTEGLDQPMGDVDEMPAFVTKTVPEPSDVSDEPDVEEKNAEASAESAVGD